VKFNLIWLVFVAAALFFSSCVSNKKFTYMQKGDVNKKDLPKDSVVRSYSIEHFDYRIQPQDILSVRFESLTSKEYDFFAQDGNQQNVNIMAGGALIIGELVDEQGEIPLPVVGKVKVAGLTVFQAQDSLQSLANRYMESPVVKVRLINFRITVLGEVNREGTIGLSNNRVTIMEALGLSGGISDIGDKKNVKLVRQTGETVEIVYLDLLDENFVTSPYYYVHQNDVLIVPSLRQRPYRRYFGQNLGVFISALSLALLVYNITQ
jgi:polysaccharide export outer membrane protein